MAISGDLGVAGSLPLPLCHSFRPTRSSTKVQFGGFFTRGFYNTDSISKLSSIEPLNHDSRRKPYRCYGVTGNQITAASFNQDIDGFLLNAVNMNLFDRLSLAWRILFPTATARSNSNANVAKQRLKMILFSDRCAVSDEAKQKIVSNIMDALSDFVEIDSHDKVQLSVSTDPDLGTMYSVTVPVKRVKPMYQESDEDYSGITSIKYKDTGETSGSVDVKFDFFVPDKN